MVNNKIPRARLHDLTYAFFRIIMPGSATAMQSLVGPPYQLLLNFPPFLVGLLVVLVADSVKIKGPDLIYLPRLWDLF